MDEIRNEESYNATTEIVADHEESVPRKYPSWLALPIAIGLLGCSSIIYSNVIMDPVYGPKLNQLLNWGTSKQPDSMAPSNLEINDPAIRFRIVEGAEKTSLIQAVGELTNGVFLISLGDCASCSRFDNIPWERDAAKNGIKVVYISGASKKHTQEFLRMIKSVMPYVLDPEHKLNSELNAYWGGRIYYFGNDWSLKWIMKGVGSPKTMYQFKDLVDVATKK